MRYAPLRRYSASQQYLSPELLVINKLSRNSQCTLQLLSEVESDVTGRVFASGALAKTRFRLGWGPGPGEIRDPSSFSPGAQMRKRVFAPKSAKTRFRTCAETFWGAA